MTIAQWNKRTIVVAGGIFLAATLLVSHFFIVQAISSTVCRGINCLQWKILENDKSISTSELSDKCLFLGSPTGIGIFNDRKLGRFFRDLLGGEYIIIGTEFLFIEPKAIHDPIVIINVNKYLIDFPYDSFCADAISIELDSVNEKLVVRRAGSAQP